MTRGALMIVDCSASSIRAPSAWSELLKVNDA